MVERRSGRKITDFLAPLVAAVLGSSPATYVSFEMYDKISERSLVNQTQLLDSLKWRADQKAEIVELQSRLREAEQSVNQIKVDIAKLTP